MSTILDRIVEQKRIEIARLREEGLTEAYERRLPDAPPPRDFRQALLQSQEIAVIAEVKKASPSAGLIREDFDPVAIAKTYEEHGASCISVLTDREFFQGDLEYLRMVRQAVGLPVLRKDFILDRSQVVEARAAGADAVLLIAEILPGVALPELLGRIEELGMQALVELYDAENLPRVLDSGATLVGVNNRNLRTFETSLCHTFDLKPRIPEGVCLVSESGIRTREEMVRLREAGVHAVLIGETLMRHEDIGAKLRELRGCGPRGQ